MSWKKVRCNACGYELDVDLPCPVCPQCKTKPFVFSVVDHNPGGAKKETTAKPDTGSKKEKGIIDNENLTLGGKIIDFFTSSEEDPPDDFEGMIRGTVLAVYDKLEVKDRVRANQILLLFSDEPPPIVTTGAAETVVDDGETKKKLIKTTEVSNGKG